jgi:hypothetical protein
VPENVGTSPNCVTPKPGNTCFGWKKAAAPANNWRTANWYCSARDSVVDLFDLAAGALLRSMPGLGSQAPDARDRLVKYFKAAPGFSTLAAVQNDGTATLFDLKTGKSD